MFTRKYWIRGRWLVIFAILAVVFEAYIVGSRIVNAPVMAEQENTLQTMASQLAHPPGDKLVDTFSGSQPGLVSITHVFTSTTAFESLDEYYTIELAKQGFVRKKTDIRLTPDMDGVRAYVAYCKGNYTAELRFKGVTNTRDQKMDEWAYAIDLSWWTRGCNPD